MLSECQLPIQLPHVAFEFALFFCSKRRAPDRQQKTGRARLFCCLNFKLGRLSASWLACFLHSRAMPPAERR